RRVGHAHHAVEFEIARRDQPTLNLTLGARATFELIEVEHVWCSGTGGAQCNQLSISTGMAISAPRRGRLLTIPDRPGRPQLEITPCACDGMYPISRDTRVRHVRPAGPTRPGGLRRRPCGRGRTADRVELS